ncbi:hypothetical protein ABC347_15735 [Sphingomonas sp. 1P06PA]
MDKQNEEVHVSTEEARAGSTPHMTRYILSISLVLIVVLFLALLLFYR